MSRSVLDKVIFPLVDVTMDTLECDDQDKDDPPLNVCGVLSIFLFLFLLVLTRLAVQTVCLFLTIFSQENVLNIIILWNID